MEEVISSLKTNQGFVDTAKSNENAVFMTKTDSKETVATESEFILQPEN